MKLKIIFNIIKSLLVDTRGFWERALTEHVVRKQLLNGFAYPLVFLTGFSALLGNILAIASTEYSFIYILVSVLFLVLSLLVSLFVIFILIKELSIKFEGNANMLAVEEITVYSLSIYWTALVVSGLLINHGPLRNFIEFLGLFGVFVFYRGVDLVLDIKKEDKVVFTLAALTIAVIVHVVVFWALGFVPDLVKTFSF